MGPQATPSTGRAERLAARTVWKAPGEPASLAAAPVGGGGAWQGDSQRPGTTGVEGAGGTGGHGCGARGQWQRLSDNTLTTSTARLEAAAGPAGPGRASSRGAKQAPPVWRAPEGPEGTGGLRGAAPNEVRPPSLAGGRALRRPEHQRGHKQHKQEGRRPRRSPAHACGKPRPADAGRGLRYPVGYEV